MRILRRLFNRVSAAVVSLSFLAGAAYAQTNWQLTTSYPLSGYQFDAVEAAGHLYVAGGFNGDRFTNVFFAAANADGSLGVWSAGTALPAADQGPGLAAYAGWVYVALESGAVYRAPLLAGGGLGDWIAEAAVLPSTSYQGVMKVYQGYLYLFGRYDGTYRNTVRMAVIKADGSLGPWGSGSLPLPLFRPAVQFYRGRVYVAGGIRTDDVPIAFSYSALVNADGSLGAWRQEADLPTPLWYHGSIIVSNQVFLLGGLTNHTTGQLNAVYQGSISELDASIASWDRVGEMPSDYSTGLGVTYAATNGNAYLIGGLNADDALYTNQVWRTTFGPVVHTNHPPVANAQTVTLLENTPTPITLTGSDPDNDPLTFVVVSGPTNGTLSGTAPNLQYQPNTNYFGDDAFTFKVNDGHVDSSVALVQLHIEHVNHPPVANPQSVSGPENARLPITLSGSDPDNDPLTYMVVNAPTNGTLSGTAPNLVYQPHTNFAGPDAFTFKVNDGHVDSGPALVQIHITPVNTPPVANPQTVSVSVNGSVAITLTASDADGDPLTYAIVAAPTNGTLSGSAPNVTYQPNAGYIGGDAFTFKVNDGHVDSAAAAVTIHVVAANSPPIPRISLAPVAHFAGNSNSLVITPNSSSARVVLDGSQSSDPDHDPLQYSWLEGTNALAAGVAATNVFAVGTHTITLAVSDGIYTETTHAAFDVITPAEAVAMIMDMVDDSSLRANRKRPLLASLRAAEAAFERGRITAAANQLRAFQNKVNAQVRPTDPALAQDLISAARQIIAAVVVKR